MGNTENGGNQFLLRCWYLSTKLGSVISQESIILWSSEAYTTLYVFLVTFQEMTQ